MVCGEGWEVAGRRCTAGEGDGDGSGGVGEGWSSGGLGFSVAGGILVSNLLSAVWTSSVCVEFLG